MNIKITLVTLAIVGFGVTVHTLAQSTSTGKGTSTTDSNVAKFKDFVLTDFYAVRNDTGKAPFDIFTVKGTPRLKLTDTTHRTTLEGAAAQLVFNIKTSLLETGVLRGGALITIFQKDQTGDDHVTKVASSTLNYTGTGTKERQAFNLDLTAPSVITSTFAPAHQVFEIKGGSGHFVMAAPVAGKQAEIQHGKLEGPVVVHFSGLREVSDPTSAFDITAKSENLEISREGTDYLVTLAGHVNVNSIGSFLTTQNAKSVTFHFTKEFVYSGMESGEFDGDIPAESLRKTKQSSGQPR